MIVGFNLKSTVLGKLLQNIIFICNNADTEIYDCMYIKEQCMYCMRNQIKHCSLPIHTSLWIGT